MPQILSAYARNTFMASYWYHRAYGDQPVSIRYDQLAAARKQFVARAEFYQRQSAFDGASQADRDEYATLYRQWMMAGKTTAAALSLIGAR